MNNITLVAVLALVALALADGDACLNDKDHSIINNDPSGAAFKKCGTGCMFSSDFKGCYQTCLEGSTIGLSDGCAACWADEASCTKSNCWLKCINPDADKCKQCSLSHCGAALKKCSGILPTVAATVSAVSDGDACLNDKDHSIINNDPSGAAFKKCGTGCMFSSDFKGCYQTCLEGSTIGLSDGCAACWADEASCTKSNCWLKCINPDADKCKQCSLSHCGAALKKCSGILPTVVAAVSAVSDGDACLNDADESKISGDPSGAAFKSCGTGCMFSSDFKGCYQTCLEGDALGLSDGCAACWADEASCTKSKCWTKCINPDADKCKQCSLSNCGAALTKCSGIQPTLAAAVSEGDACLNDADESKINNDPSGAAFKSCGTGCIISSDFKGCYQTCLEGDALGLSDACAACWADEASCTKSKCWTKCFNPDADKCKQCSLRKCGAALKSCAGLVPKVAQNVVEIEAY